MANIENSIPVNISARWQQRGRVVSVVVLLSWWMMLCLSYLAYIEADWWGGLPCFLSLLYFPLVFCYCLPAWTGHYPAWMVKILGRRHLLYMKNEAEKIFTDAPLRASTQTGNQFLWIMLIFFLAGMYMAMAG